LGQTENLKKLPRICC